MRFVSYNIQYGVGKDWTRDLDRIAAVLHGADVIALQEVARHLPMVELEDQPARLAELLPGYYRAFGRSIDVQAPEADPTAPRMQFGNMLLARCPIVATRTHLLPKRRLVDYPSTERVAVEAVIQTASRAIRVYSIHLSPNNVQERKLQVEALLRIQRDARLEGTVCSGAHFLSKRNRLSLPDVVDDAVFMGDFNLEPSSEEYTMLTGTVDPMYGRVTSVDHLSDVWVKAGHAEDEGVTCPLCPENDTHRDMRIDYGFVSAGLADRVERAWIDNEAQGSDHQPAWFELDV